MDMQKLQALGEDTKIRLDTVTSERVKNHSPCHSKCRSNGSRVFSMQLAIQVDVILFS